jgi:tRNA-2-methylthio-N6-dimethylallyladenosine synthase
MAGQVAPEVMDDRLQRLQARISKHSTAFNAACVGRTVPVLIEKKGRKPGQMIGKSPYLQSVFLDTAAPVGAIVHARLTHALPNSLGGEEVTLAAAA